ncbi:response regulator [Paenibacillus sp. F411]|uniref:response regulator transcription factor n=1 Tax=Paenibacillus sp. F411 TaxID=2820239 RepID=UPI001AAE435D|nr:response regulator [Paenibacillus sp. F411]MBO2942416.1 response regulator [Paenibacillus sp. F411]
MNRVHIVDDELLIRQGLSKKVSSFHNNFLLVGSSENGEEAMRFLSSYHVDICITDISMPVMDGLKLIQEIKNTFSWMECIIISSYDEFAYAKQAIQLGAKDYILKPIDTDILKDSLLQAVETIERDRHNQAVEILMRNIPHSRDMHQRWVNLIRSVQFETLPLLVVDTLDLLENWIGSRYYLLKPLSMAWLQYILEDLKDNRVTLNLKEGTDWVLGDEPILHSEARRYFRLCAVRRLEEGAHLLFDAMKNVMNQTNRRVIEQVKHYIQTHYAEKVSLQELAEQVAMSRTYLANYFKQETGMTIWSYLIEVRMQKARELLLNSSLKGYEIALQIGYENGTHFSQLFKEYYGLSPIEYKKRLERD